MKYFLIFLISLPAFAMGPSMNKEDFCNDRATNAFVKGLVQSSENLMGFSNHGGFINGGVCWWHSRFQRNALYLTYYNPAAPRPTPDEARTIIRNIRNANGAIEIPGFINFREFSYHFSGLIQAELEMWQRFETYRGTFVRGLRGSAVVHPDFMKVLMDNLYKEVELKGNIAYEKLQLKGATAHAWLVINMKKLKDGYDLEVLDSNFPYRTSTYSYRLGDNHLNYYSLGAFTPYLEFTNEMEWINEAVKDACQK